MLNDKVAWGLGGYCTKTLIISRLIAAKPYQMLTEFKRMSQKTPNSTIVRINFKRKSHRCTDTLIRLDLLPLPYKLVIKNMMHTSTCVQV